MAGRGHNGHAWRKVRRLILALDDPDRDVHCWLCGNPIDKRLRWPHPASPSVDLVVPYARGGDPLDPSNLRPAHLAHNVGRRDRSAQAYAAKVRTPPRQWIKDEQP